MKHCVFAHPTLKCNKQVPPELFDEALSVFLESSDGKRFKEGRHALVHILRSVFSFDSRLSDI